MQIAPNSILGKSHGHKAPSDKLNIAVVGIGGMGITNIQHVFETENIVALCDVDWKYAKPVLDCFSRAGKYKDFRRMFDEMGRDIDAVMVATNRPVWPQGLETPAKAHKIPATLDWDLFIGPARMRPFNKIYHPWNWRGWWDFGTGALGDMGCHVLHPAFRALKLGYPVSVEAASSPLFIDCAPQSEYVKFVYPARKGMPKVDFRKSR